MLAWQLQPNDPSIVAWLVTGGYLVAAGLGFHLSRRSLRSGCKEEGRCWLFLTLVAAALGINKELDLQTLLIELVRETLRPMGWHDLHRAVQRGLAALAMVVMAVFAWRWVRANGRFFRLRPLVAVGMVLVGAYVLLRVGSINHLESGPLTDGEGPIGPMIELCGAGLLVWGMVREAANPGIPLPPA